MNDVDGLARDLQHSITQNRRIAELEETAEKLETKIREQRTKIVDLTWQLKHAKDQIQVGNDHIDAQERKIESLKFMRYVLLGAVNQEFPVRALLGSTPSKKRKRGATDDKAGGSEKDESPQ